MKLRYFLFCASSASLAITAPVMATDRFLGEIFAVANIYCPRGTVEANGQILSINSHSALFALFGTTYGGDGQTNFALPDLSGRYVVGQGQGQGIPKIREGETRTVKGAKDADAGNTSAYGLALRYCIVLDGIFPPRN